MSKTSVSVIDSSYANRAGLIRALASVGRHAEPFEDVREFLGGKFKRQIVLVHDEGTAVADLLNWCKETGKPIAVVPYAERLPSRAVVEAMRLGAADYFDWPMAADELDQIIDDCVEIFEPRWEHLEAEAQVRELVNRLTPREKEVLGCMAKGFSSRAIGEHLSISPRTVEVHRAHLLSKMQASNSPDAVRIALKAGLEIR